jgi:hypothetical protein
MSEENNLDFPADEHSKILRKHWEEIRTESDNAEATPTGAMVIRRRIIPEMRRKPARTPGLVRH